MYGTGIIVGYGSDGEPLVREFLPDKEGRLPTSEPPKNDHTPPVYYTVKEVAAIWKCHPQTVYERIWSGKLKARKVGGGWRILECAL